MRVIPQASIDMPEGRQRLKTGERVAILTESEYNLLAAINELRFGRIEQLEVHEGQPRLAECTRVVHRLKL